jgi:hypothetical protein
MPRGTASGIETSETQCMGRDNTRSGYTNPCPNKVRSLTPEWLFFDILCADYLLLHVVTLCVDCYRLNPSLLLLFITFPFK